MYSLKIHKKAAKFFISCNHFERKHIKIKLNLLVENPYLHPQLDIKQLKGVENVYRLRIGKIRIVYEIRDNELVVLVISVGSRGDIYKRK